MPEYADVPPEVMAKLRDICSRLPDAYEEQAWTGRRWRVRKKTFAHVFVVDSERGPVTGMQFRADGPELDVLVHSGHPFYKAGWGDNVMNMVLDGDINWDEVGELITESYCIMAPKKLAALVQQPDS